MFINQKSQEISYALVRVAAYIRRQEFRQRIERLAFQLLEETSGGNLESALKTIASLESLINLGKSIYEIEPVNAKIIIGEIKSLDAAIRQIAGLEELPNLENTFSGLPAVIAENNGFGNGSGNNNGNGNGNGINSTIRQSAILEKIRQSDGGQAQLKDILAAFPDVSERTMRYDLQKLCAQGLLERIGNGGPGGYYLLKESRGVESNSTAKSDLA